MRGRGEGRDKRGEEGREGNEATLKVATSD